MTRTLSRAAILTGMFVVTLPIVTSADGPSRGQAVAAASKDYFPPPESSGGWRMLDDRDDIRQITVKQLLNHTSGITPEATGAKNQGPWRHVLGHDGDPLTARLAFDPGTKCGYSSFAFYHASLVCENVTGKPYDQFAIEALFRPIGVERWTFEYFDGGGPDGDKRYGRHPSHGIGMPARDLARIAYCMLRGGKWRDKQVVPKWFVDETAAPTHDVKKPELRFNRAAESFSHGWELPARLTDGRGDGIPQDARFKPGSGVLPRGSSGICRVGFV